MNRWIGGLGLLLGIAITVSPHSTGKCQDLKPKFQAGATTGVSFYDDDLSFDSSPFVRLSAGYRMSDFFQLNLAFAVSPTQQRIAAAASELTTDVSVFTYFLNVKLSRQEPLLSRFRPFVSLGGGGIILDPAAVTFDLGGGQTVRLDAPTDHRFATLIGSGVGFLISRTLELRIEYQRIMHDVQRVRDDAVTTDTVTANHHLWGIGLSTSF